MSKYNESCASKSACLFEALESRALCSTTEYLIIPAIDGNTEIPVSEAHVVATRTPAVSSPIPPKGGPTGNHGGAGSLTFDSTGSRLIPQFSRYAAAGMHLTSVKLYFTNAIANKTNVYLSYAFSDTIVSSVEFEGAGEPPEYAISMNFASVTWVYTPYGSGKSTNKAGYSMLPLDSVDSELLG